MRTNGVVFGMLACAIFIMAIVSSCQKDSAVNAPTAANTSINADSSVISSPGNYLAAAGKLTVKLNDSTYTFDARRDSIAFINIQLDDDTRYFGITAINKEHTMSFGISSAGFASSDIIKSIAGGQFLLSTDVKKPVMQLSLSKNSAQKDVGSISLKHYNEGNELAKGTFYTFLAHNDKANSPYYRVEGTFDLKLK